MDLRRNGIERAASAAMLEAGDGSEHRFNTMEVRQFIRPDIAVSAIAHLSVLALVILFTEVHPFGSVTAEPIAVDLVTSDEVDKQPDPTPSPSPTPTPQFSLPDLKVSTQPETPNAASHPASPPSRPKQPA